MRDSNDKKIISIREKMNSIVPLEKIRVCAYVRVSTENKEQLSSLKNQTDYYSDKLQRNPEYEFCGIFSDKGISGNKVHRPGLQEMLEKARKNEIDLIVTKSISRFARNTLTLLRIVRELREKSVGIIFEEQNINTLRAEGELMLTVLGAIAEEERKSVCENIRWGVKRRFENGQYKVDTSRLLGYVRDDKGDMIIDEEQACIVRRIYSLFIMGVPGYQIAKIFNAEAVTTFSPKPWASHRILRIISNEKYVGDTLLQKTYANELGKSILNRGGRPQYYIKDSHPAIISRVDWQKAKQIRISRKCKPYPFTSKIRCPYCGASLIRVVHQRKWVSWICLTYMQRGKDVCKGARISESILKKLVGSGSLLEVMVLMEVNNEKRAKDRTEKDFYLIPASKHDGSRRKE
ncbi:recombinase family protein [Clostridia bacterium]|nr:recombinase family protein [Clostridia bacterium]